MWFDNPFSKGHTSPDNLALLLRNLGTNGQEVPSKRSTTVDVWRGNYDDFKQPKPKLTIMKRGPEPMDLLAEVKTLMPEAPTAPTTRTLLCHHATADSGHITCNIPGKCSVHSLQKPSAFEVSKLDQCRSVIDLYEQGVMSGVINSNQQITRDGTTQQYSKTISCANSNCLTHPGKTKSGTKNNELVVANIPRAKPPGYVTVTKKNVTFAKDLVEEKIMNDTGDYFMKEPRVGSFVKEQVKGAENKMLVKCVNPHCGRTSLSGEKCQDSRVTMPTRAMISEEKERKAALDKSCNEQLRSSCSEPSLLPSCYYKHARSRMERLKEKSRTLVEKAYAPPSSLAGKSAENRDLVKKYNTVKQKKLRRKKFFIPNVSADSLYQPTRTRRASYEQQYSKTKRQSSMTRGELQGSQLRQTYPHTRRPGSVKTGSRTNDTIKVAVDKHGPLVFAFQNGKIHRMAISEVESEHCRLDF